MSKKTIGGIEYKVVDAIPKAMRGWAPNALRDFLDTGEKIVAIEFDNDGKALAKANALKKVLTTEGNEFSDKVSVARRGSILYFERL